MKVTALLLTAAFLQVGARGLSQRVTLSVKDAPIETVFRSIERQTGIGFLYTRSMLEGLPPVTLEIKGAPLQEVLDKCLTGRDLSYTLQEGTIVISRRPAPLPAAPITQPPPILHGKVVDSSNVPLAGVSVIVKGSRNGTHTDADGSFTLKADAGQTLVFSSVGFETREVRINTLVLTVGMRIQLMKHPSQLDQTVIKGYYNTTKRLNTGDVSTITAEQIAEQPVSNPLAAMEGRVTGITIVQNSGVTGGAFTTRIQGQNSIRSGNEPLVIVDGVPYYSAPLGSINGNAILGGASPLNFINPSDIARIEVLKGGDATAIYGSRGANGVLLITTKKGVSGKTTVDVNVYDGMSKITRAMKLLTTPQYLQMRDEAFANDGETPGPGDYDVNGVWDSTRYTDWQKLLIGGTGHITEAELSLSGGNGNTRFLAGGAYHHETTVFPGDFGDQKISAHFNISHLSENKRLRVNITGSYVNDQNHLFYQDLTYYALTTPPNAPPPYNADGSVDWADGTFVNPMGGLLQQYQMNTSNLIANSVVSYELLPGLQIKANMGFNDLQMSETSTTPIASFNPAWGITTGSASFVNTHIQSWIVEPQADLQKKLGKGKLEVLAGMTLQQNLTNGQEVDGSGYRNDALLGTLAGAATVTAATPNYAQYRYDALFARASYNYDEKYILNLTGRRDGSSRFGPGKEFANLGAIGAAWIFSDEKFIHDALPFLHFGKLRGSYGIAGNDQIANYGYLDTYTPTTYPYSGISGLVPSRLFNPDYSWEINRKAEGGLDLGFLGDRIFVSADYYRNRSSNQLVGYPLPSITGFTSIQYNLPAVVQNTGWELEGRSVNIKSKDFSWTTDFNLTIPRNVLIAFPNLANSPYALSYVIGKSLTVQEKFHYLGVDPQTGIYQYTDVNKDGQITYPADNLPLKQYAITAYGGLGNKITYRQWQLDLLFQFVRQTQLNYLNFFAPPGTMSNQPAFVMSRWQKPGDRTTIEAFTQDPGTAAYQAWNNEAYYSDNALSDASYIRLKNFAVSYSLPEKELSRLRLQNCRFYLQAQNLLTITHYPGLDPENQSSLPPLKTITAGIQVSF